MTPTWLLSHNAQRINQRLRPSINGSQQS